MTPIFLTPEEAILFVQFQKHFALVQLLESIKAFDIKNGSVTLHFDSYGKIASIDKNEHLRVNH